MRSRCRFLLGNQGRIPPPSTPAYLGVASFPPRPSHRVSRYYLSLRCVPCALQQRFSPAEPTSWDRQSDSGQRLCSIREISKERRSTSVLHARNGERRIVTGQCRCTKITITFRGIRPCFISLDSSLLFFYLSNLNFLIMRIHGNLSSSEIDNESKESRNIGGN